MDGFREYSKSIEDEEILDDAYTYWEDILERESRVRDHMRKDALFLEDHWDEGIREDREADKRPAIQIPRINQFLNQVKNEQRQNHPSIKVSPVDDGADVKAAENRQGVIRHIQYDSQAMNAYQCAFDWAVDVGRGFFRIRTDWVSDRSMDQKIIIDAIPKPLQVYMGKHEKLDYSDCKQAFILEDMSKKAFKKKYPKASEQSWASTDSKWIRDDDLTVAEFYCIWAKKRELWAYEDGQVFYKDELSDEEKMIEPARKRTVHEPYVMWYKMTRHEILEKKHVPGKYIPIIPVVGVERFVDGELKIKGMVRDAKDVQKMYDYWASTEAEYLSLSVKAQWVIAAGQIGKYKKLWQNANKVNYAYLPYEPIDHNGSMVPPPQRQMPPQVPSGTVTAKMGCVDDMKAVTGIYDAGIGNVGNEVSGRAILARQRESDTANYHYIDNLRVALTHAGRIINDWLPIYYQGPRIVKIMGEENDEQELKLGHRDDAGQEISLGDGTYDVVVTMGASYNTKRQEAVESMMEFLRVVPSATPLVYDLFVKNMDWPGSQEISERLKKTVPPQILETEDNEQRMQMMLQQMQQQVQQDKMLMEEMSQQIQGLSAELEDKNIEVESKLEIAEMNNRARVTVAKINAMSDNVKEERKMRNQFWTDINRERIAQ